MKKLFLVAVLFLFGCEEVNINQKSTDATYTSSGMKINEFKYDGCEYIGKLWESF